MTLVGNFLPRAQTKYVCGANLIPDATAPKQYILLAQLLPPVEINRKAKHLTQQLSRASDILGVRGVPGGRKNWGWGIWCSLQVH